MDNRNDRAGQRQPYGAADSDFDDRAGGGNLNDPRGGGSNASRGGGPNDPRGDSSNDPRGDSDPDPRGDRFAGPYEDDAPPTRRYDPGLEAADAPAGRAPVKPGVTSYGHSGPAPGPVAPRPAHMEPATGPGADDSAAERDRRRDLESRARIDQRNHVVTRVVQVVDYLFYLLYALLGIRFVLTLLGASETAGFAQFINGITQPFYGPFSGIVARPALNGGFLDFPLIIALLAYMILHFAVRGLLRLLMASETGAVRR